LRLAKSGPGAPPKMLGFVAAIPPRKFCEEFLERHFANSVGNLKYMSIVLQRNTTNAVCVLRREPHSSVCVEWFGSVAPTPQSPHDRAGVTGATIWKIGHEDRGICRSPRGEGSFSALRSGGDRNHADRQFTFVDLLLSHTVVSRPNV
jgi:hypothetical protein